MEHCQLTGLSAKANRCWKRQGQQKMQEELDKMREENHNMKLSQALLMAKVRKAHDIVGRFKVQSKKCTTSKGWET